MGRRLVHRFPEFKKSRLALKQKILILFLTAFAVIILDQISKVWVEQNLYIYQSISIIPNFFSLTYIQNTGGAWGILSGFNSALIKNFFIIFTLLTIGLVGIFYFKLKPHQKTPAIALALIIGGAVGNLIDRIRLGAVIDFLDLYYRSFHWPAFNVADSAITIGTIILGIAILFKKW